MQILDGGRAFNGGNPPAEAPVQRRACRRTRRRNAPPQTILGAEQKAWFKDQLQHVDGDLEDLGELARHARSARRPAEPAAGLTKAALAERAFTHHRRRRLRHAPTSSAARSTISSATRRSPASRSSRATATASGPAMRPRLPPGKFEPVGLSFVGASLIEPGRDGGLRAQLSRRIIRCGRCSSPTGRAAPSPTGRSTCC